MKYSIKKLILMISLTDAKKHRYDTEKFDDDHN